MFKENVKMQPKCIECGIELKLYEIDYEKNGELCNVLNVAYTTFIKGTFLL